VLGDALRAAEWLEGSAAPAPEERQTQQDAPDETLPGWSDLEGPATELEPESEPSPAQPQCGAAAVAGPAQPTASPVPPAPAAPELPCAVTDTEIRLAVGDRGYRVRGLDANGAEAMKVNLRVHRGAGADLAFYLDTLDLYQAKARRAFTPAAAEAVGVEPAVIERDLGRVLLQLESVQEQRRQAAAQPQSREPALSASEREAALAWLRAPDLIQRLRDDLAQSGVVGEATNTLVAYLVATSRLLDRPLALIVQSSSAAGKSALLDAVLALFPEQSRAQYAALTGQSLYYLGEHELSHRILAVAEEEGAAQATYALKLLQSEGRLTIASTGKDPTTGNLQTQQYRVEGPVALMLTTTAAELDAELANRCLVVGVDEDRSQTAAIQAEQRRRRTRAGLAGARERQAIRSRHHAIQQLLELIAVVNPYAEHLTFAAEPTRTRRDHDKYLTLIEAIAVLHQHQRPVHTLGDGEDGIRYIEATLDDIAQANELAHAVLGRSLDELPPQTRHLLGAIQRFVESDRQARGIERADYRFSRRDLRTATGWGDTQLKVHLARLVELEYVLVHRQGARYVYELVFDGSAEAEAAPHCSGLIDVAALRAGEGLRPADPDRSEASADRSGDTAKRSGTGRAGVGARSEAADAPEAGEKPRSFNPLAADAGEPVGLGPDVRLGQPKNDRPYTLTGTRS
jgi:post-segregation antitoxin (ccd killing protein)